MWPIRIIRHNTVKGGLDPIFWGCSAYESVESRVFFAQIAAIGEGIELFGTKNAAFGGGLSDMFPLLG